RQLGTWRRNHPGARDLQMHVNMSVRELQESDVVDAVRGSLLDSGIPPGDLVIELTESLWAHGTEGLLRNLRGLKTLGVQIAVDDFGAGYASLSYLRWFPVDVVKIDRSLVGQVDTNTNEQALIQGIAHLTQSMGIVTVVEGIERLEQQAALVRLGCLYGQGYYFARPMVPLEIEMRLGRGAEEVTREHGQPQ
ncbi:MAG TPA: EAL domain-containing protein, partial [Symbiobacteriaceae bacterium]|nr:EAL domain-containing protein [Symbiobacteriaceae bacterium]